MHPPRPSSDAIDSEIWGRDSKPAVCQARALQTSPLCPAHVTRQGFEGGGRYEYTLPRRPEARTAECFRLQTRKGICFYRLVLWRDANIKGQLRKSLARRAAERGGARCPNCRDTPHRHMHMHTEYGIQRSSVGDRLRGGALESDRTFQRLW